MPGFFTRGQGALRVLIVIAIRHNNNTADYKYTASRDTQIYAGDIHNPDEVNDDTRWQDWDGDILLDVVIAEDEKEAVKAVAASNDLHESTLYAVRHGA